MAAIAHPMPHDRRARPSHLRIVRDGELPPPRPARVASTTYRRRRVAVAALAVGIVLAVRVLLGAFSTPSAPPAVPAPPVLVASTTYVVQPGDTLWTIARALQPVGDVRPLVDELARRRHGRALQVGERVDL